MADLWTKFDRYHAKVRADEPAQFICNTSNVANARLIVDTLSRTYDRTKLLLEGLSTGQESPANSTTRVLPLQIQPAVKQINSSTYTARLPLVSEVWNGGDPRNYYTQIQAGVKEKDFYVVLDTGSSILWLQSSIGGGSIPDQNLYTPPLTAKSVGTRSVEYGDGETVRVQLYTDNVTVGGLSATAQSIGAASLKNMQPSIRESRTNGLLGLASTLSTTLNALDTNLAQTLYAEGKIKYPSFSFIGPRNDPNVVKQSDHTGWWQEPRGEFAIGALPEDVRDDRNIVWSRVMNDPDEPQRWIIPLNKVSINGKTWYRDQWAFIDSGTSYIVTSKAVHLDLKQGLKGRSTNVNGEQNANLFSFPKGELKTVEFEFGPVAPKEGEAPARSFQLTDDDLNLGREETDMNMCISSFVTFPGYDFPDDTWILGGIVMDNFVTVFDFGSGGDSKIGFAGLRA